MVHTLMQWATCLPILQSNQQWGLGHTYLGQVRESWPTLMWVMSGLNSQSGSRPWTLPLNLFRLPSYWTWAPTLLPFGSKKRVPLAKKYILENFLKRASRKFLVEPVNLLITIRSTFQVTYVNFFEIKGFLFHFFFLALEKSRAFFFHVKEFFE